MSRASTVKPPALAMPSRRTAVSAGFPVRRRRPDAGDCRHQGEYAGACPFWTGSLFLCLFSFFLLPKGRDLPKHGLRGGLLCMRTGGQGRGSARKAPAGKTGFAESDAVWCGRLPHARAAPCGAGSRMRCRARRYRPSPADGRETPPGSCLAERLLPHGGIVPPCAVVPSSSARWRSDRKGISIFHALMGAARGRRRGVCPG